MSARCWPECVHRCVVSQDDYVLNNMELERHSISAVCDDHTLHELCLPAYRTAVTEGGAASVMCSYNKVNGTVSVLATLLLLCVLAPRSLGLLSPTGSTRARTSTRCMTS